MRVTGAAGKRLEECKIIRDQPIFAGKISVENKIENPLHDLQKILNEVSEWNLKYNTHDEQKLYKFTDIER